MAILGLAIAGEDVPVPQSRPDQPGDAAQSVPPSAIPEEVPAPEPRPEPPAQPSESSADKPDQDEAATPPPVRPAQMPADEVACRAKLTDLGVAFKEADQLADPAGCSVPWPISISSLSKQVEIAPDAVLNCATALQAAMFTRDVMAPRAQSILGSALVSIRHDSAYVCRPRHGTSKLSEHAFGNALDIGAFGLEDDRSVVVGSAAKREEAEFMLAVRLAACGPFKTVLGPGSDPDHAAHFHVDLAKRRSGSLFCQ